MRYNLDPSVRKTCTTQRLLNQGYFWIRKDIESHNFYKFRAPLQKYESDPFMSQLDAYHGNCFYIKTKDRSKRCGLATALFYGCFLDNDVTKNGGIDPDKDVQFNRPKNHEMKKIAKAKCAIIVRTICQPSPPTPVAVCVGYMKGATKAYYSGIFMVDNNNKMTVLTLPSAISKFIDNPGVFLNKRGREWYLCKEH